MTEQEYQMARLMQQVEAMMGLERQTYISNYDHFKHVLCEIYGFSRNVVSSAWNWFKSLW